MVVLVREKKGRLEREISSNRILGGYPLWGSTTKPVIERVVLLHANDACDCPGQCCMEHTQDGLDQCEEDCYQTIERGRGGRGV